MAAELESPEGTTSIAAPRKRKLKHKKNKNPNKKLKKAPAAMAAAASNLKNPSKKVIKLFRKRAREYNSDEDDDGQPTAGLRNPGASGALQDREDAASSGDSGKEEDEQRGLDAVDDLSGGFEGDDEDEEDGALQGIKKFVEGSRAFRVAFLKIMKKNLPNDPLGPILSAHKKLVAEKLAEEEAEHKVKGEAKKEKHLVSKAQNPQKGLNPSKSKDAKVLAKQRKQTFLSELQKPTTQALDSPSSFNTSRAPNSTNNEHSNKPGWAPLSDTYMLSSKLKDWDKMPDSAGAVDQDNVSLESSSDEE